MDSTTDMTDKTRHLLRPTSRTKESSTSFQRWPVMTGAMAWDGAKLADSSQYIYQLSESDKTEIETALSNFKDLDLNGPDIDQQNFVLPALRPVLLGYAKDIHRGRGFMVIRGLDPNKYSAEDNVMMFLGISSYIGENRAKQDNLGNMLVHLCHDRMKYPNRGQGPARHSNKASPFHTDFFCDIIALHVRDIAAEGGAVKLASSWHIYNELAVSRSDLLETLASADWCFDSRGKLFPEIHRPLLFIEDGQVILDFSRRPLTGAQTDPEHKVSRLSQIQNEALKEIERIARDSQLILDLRPGDMIFVNNHALLHSREEFRDTSDHTRHLVRLWLRNEALSWRLPSPLMQGNRRIFFENELRERWAVGVTSSLGLFSTQSQCVDTDLSH